jgi:hypothetical protein
VLSAATSGAAAAFLLGPMKRKTQMNKVTKDGGFKMVTM